MLFLNVDLSLISDAMVKNPALKDETFKDVVPDRDRGRRQRQIRGLKSSKNSENV